MKWDATMKDRKSSKKKKHRFLTNEKIQWMITIKLA